MTNSLTVLAKGIFKYIDIFAAMQKLLIFFQQKKFHVFTIFQDRNFNLMLANNFVKF